MKKVLYIGQFQPGTTSYSRGCGLRDLLPDAQFAAVDTLVPYNSTSRSLRSAGFRWKRGPLISRINKFVLENIGTQVFDLIWVDKAVFLTAATTKILRGKTTTLIHFTPDPAFKFHRSRHFESSIGYYDLVVTTKSYEVAQYIARSGKKKLLLVSQGYDPGVHYPRIDFAEKRAGVCFIGHHEPSREALLEAILQSGIEVFVAGRGWASWARPRKSNAKLSYGGEGVYAEEYARKISEYQVSLGLLSDWVPEKHTTRTFEIPACGTILATPRTDETLQFFEENEALFFDSPDELMEKLSGVFENPDQARNLANSGNSRVRNSACDWSSIVDNVLKTANFPCGQRRF